MIEGAILMKPLVDGRIVAIIPLTYARARITIGYDEQCYTDGW